VISRAPDETEELGRRLGALLRAGDVVALKGELGAGKTTLVRGVGQGLGIVDEITSPSFALMHEYAGTPPLFHFDAWMAGREALFLEGGGAEYLGGEGVAIVEWAERVEAYLPRPHLVCRLAHRSPEAREIRLTVEAGSRADRAELERLRSIAEELGGSS